MNKVFADTYWLIAGRWSGEKPKLIEKAWLTSIMPPFYRGAGVAIRLGGYSIRFGVCYPRMPVTVDPDWYVDTRENLEALVGYEMDNDNKEIRSWGYSTSKKKHDTPASSDASSSESAAETSST